MSLLTDFSIWLGQTPLSAAVTGYDWLVPALQVVHILAIAALLISAIHINLRAIGLLEREILLAEISTRFLPVLWVALGTLAFTGFLLIASEPNRAIFRTVFWIKLALALFATMATASQSRLAETAHVHRLLALGALVGWALVIFAGRWIAYADPWVGAPG
jgi:hypothetical protein